MNNILSVVSVMKSAGYIILSVLMLMVMITVHEFGHYIVGKIFKFKINEFAIGMGPAIFKTKLKNGEYFSIRLLPFGGYCSFEGEDEDNKDENAFNNKKPWQRILVLIAGATMNYLLAIIIIFVSMNTYGMSIMGASKIRPSDSGEEIFETQSLQDGDFIIAVEVDGKKSNIYMATDFITVLNHQKAKTTIYADVLRNGEKVYGVPVALRCDVECKNLTEVNNTYEALGIGTVMQIAVRNENAPDVFNSGDYVLKFNDSEEYADCSFVFSDKAFVEFVSDKEDEVGFYVSRNGERQLLTFTLGEDWSSIDKTNTSAVLSYFGITGFECVYLTDGTTYHPGFFSSIGRTFEYSVKIGSAIFRSLGELITGKIGINAVGGTVTTIVTTSKVMSYGFRYALDIMAFIGVNLAIFNLLPIPALDGSRVVFCIIEWIRKKPVNRSIEAVIHTVGFLLILGFAILVDILQFI